MATDTTTALGDDPDGRSRLVLLGVGGLLSLCCLVAAPATTSAVGTQAAGGASPAVGGGLVRILVSAITVGCIGAAVRLRADS